MIVLVMYENKAPPKSLAILGSTGSIGQQTLDVVRAHPDKFKIVALTAGHNLELLKSQINEFRPKMYFLQVNPDPITSEYGRRTPLEEIVVHPDVDVVVAAISGTAGLRPVMTALLAGKTIALANKEPLVMAGNLIWSEIKKSSGRILPVDSEHSAIWQCLKGENSRPSKIIITASGGPFLGYPPARLAAVTPEQALRHPSWKMGKKVTIDSATLMNKGLEVIEAHWLFDVKFDQIEILIHPQSIVHSMVVLADGSLKAHLSFPDMRLPIQYALTHPERMANPGLPVLDWDQVHSLQFEKPDLASFPCLNLALQAGRRGGSFPAALCGADEAAVDLFLQRRIPFTGIYEVVQKVLERHDFIENPDLDSIIQVEMWARALAYRLADGGKVQ
jgi:1-deoxy-D-xylulose-5-phosphate reductoisomerase